MVEKKSVGEVTTITRENRLIASVSGLFAKAVIMAKRIGSSVARGTLLAPQTATGLYVIFMEQSLHASNTSSGQKDIEVVDSSKFRAGDVITIVDDAPGTEDKTIDTIDSTTNTITVTVNLTNSYTTANNARVYLKDGSEISANVVILKETVQNISSDIETGVIVNGVVNENQVQGNISDLTKADVQRLTFI